MAEKLYTHIVERWHIGQFWNELESGDIAILWQAQGKKKCVSGIWGIAQIIEAPHCAPTSNIETWPLLRNIYAVPNPIEKDVIAADPVAGGISLLTQKDGKPRTWIQGPNPWKITSEQWNALYELVSKGH